MTAEKEKFLSSIKSLKTEIFALKMQKMVLTQDEFEKRTNKIYGMVKVIEKEFSGGKDEQD